MWIFSFLTQLFASCNHLLTSVEKLMICCINLSLFSLCLAYFHSFFLSQSCLGCLQANEGEKKLKQHEDCFVFVLPVIACQDFALEKLVSAASHTFHFSSSFETATRPFQPQSLICLLCGPVSSQYEPSLPTVAFAAVFSQEQNRT